MIKDNFIIIESFKISVSNRYNTNTNYSRLFLLSNNNIKNGDKKIK